MLFRSEKVEQARKKFEEALAKGGGLNADASYGLARVAISQGDADLGRGLFNQALDSDPDPYVRSMSHVYIARISDVMGLREQAVEHYQLALGRARNAGPRPGSSSERAAEGFWKPSAATTARGCGSRNRRGTKKKKRFRAKAGRNRSIAGFVV